MPSIPQRYSLVSKTAESIHHLLRKGEWGDRLPAERILSQRLQVSRSTLRKALLILKREELIQILPGHGARIVQRPRGPKRRSKTVGVLCDAFPWDVSNLSLVLLAKLEHQLHLAGFEMRVFTDQLVAKRQGPSRIRTYTRQVDAACWILFYSNLDVQRWFAKEEIPTLIVGHPFPGVDLPFIDINFEAACRHAMGKLLRLGHRRLALLLPNTQDASLLARERGFRRAVELHSSTDASLSVLFHDKSPVGIHHSIDSIFCKSSHPTALVVADAWHALTAVSHLIRSGFQVPEEVSVISTDFELFLHANDPEIDSYMANHPDYGIRLSRLVIQLAQVGILPTKPNWIVPHHRPGGTIGIAKVGA